MPNVTHNVSQNRNGNVRHRRKVDDDGFSKLKRGSVMKCGECRWRYGKFLYKCVKSCTKFLGRLQKLG